MMKPLGEVASVSTAYPFRSKVESVPGGDIAVVQMRNVDANNVEGIPTLSAIWLRNEEGRFNRHLIQAGDLLFQSRGARHPVMMAATDVRAIAGSGVHVIRVNPAIVIPEYLGWWLNHPSSQARLVTDVARGSNIPFVSKADLELFQVPVPSLEVQRQIVAVDRLRSRERALQNRLDALQQQLVDSITLRAVVQKGPQE